MSLTKEQQEILDFIIQFYPRHHLSQKVLLQINLMKFLVLCILYQTQLNPAQWNICLK